MKKPKPITLPKASADIVALNLKRGIGHDRAWKVAANLAKNLSETKTGDVNHDIFPIEKVRKAERFWTQVRNILAK